MLNNAGINKPLMFLDITEENWHKIMDVNALGVLMCMQETARQMIAQGTGGKIINTASVASRQGFDNVAPYCASKSAVVSLTLSGFEVGTIEPASDHATSQLNGRVRRTY